MLFRPPNLRVIFALLYAHQITFAAGVPTYNVSGRNGQNGQNGYSQTGSAGTGSDGSRGGDATEAEAGQNAGDINLKLQRQQGVYVINGVVHSADGKAQNVNQVQVSLAETGNLVLQAAGGHGGRGGNGGDGQGGGRGYSGTDATRYSSGSDGGPGGDGGDSGIPTNGKDAGKGGKVTLELSEKDTALLMLVETSVEGGKGGLAGQHGTPGSGGSGGSGGSSYSWTETETWTETSTDGDGNTTTETKSNTTYHSNPGGSDGYSGSNGSRPNVSTTNGRNGDKGQQIIKVVSENGETKTFQQRYDLVLQSYDYNSEDFDGILEPGEKVLVQKIKIKNTGGMPTPAFTKVRLFLRNGAFSIADSVELTIPKTLVPGESFEFTNEHLSFTIKNTILKEIGEDRIVWNDTVRPLAEMTEVNREFKGFSQDRPITITFPIELESVMAERSLAPGEKSKIVLKIKNLSTKDFGSESELKRELEIKVKRSGGDINAAHYKITDENGKAWDVEEGIFKAIAHLKAGESTLVEGTVEVAKDAEAYRSLDLGLALELGTPKGAQARSRVQKKGVVFRVSQTYQVDPTADVLLVVNNSTDRDMVKAASDLAHSLGLKTNVWDISYYGEMALTKMLDTGSSLIQDFKNKTILVLNNEFKTVNGSRQAHQLISHQELVEAASRQGLNALFVGGRAEDIGHDISLRAIDPNVDTKISVAKWKLFGKPKGIQLEKEGIKKLNELLKAEPLSNFQVIHKFEPKMIKAGPLGIGKVWSLGTLEVIQSIDSQHGQLITLAGANETDLKPADLMTREAQLSLFMAVPFERRIQILNKIIGADSPTVEALHVGQVIVESILFDLAQEQAQARTLKYNFATNSKIRARLPKLQNILTIAEKLQARVSQLGSQALWMELITGIRELGKEKSHWWDKLVPFGTASEFKAETIKLADKIQQKVFPKSGALIQDSSKYTRGDISQLKAQAPRPDLTKVEGQARLTTLVGGSSVVASSKVASARNGLSNREDEVKESQARVQAASQTMKTGVECRAQFK